MANAIFRGQIFLNQYSNGWVHTWYFQGASIIAVFNRVDSIVKALMGCCHVSTSVLGTRIVAVDPKEPRQASHDPYQTTFGKRGQTGDNKLTLLEAEDVVQTTALLNVDFTNGNQKTVGIRGLYDPDVVRSSNTGRPLPSDGLLKALKLYSQALTNNQAMGRYVDRSQTRYDVSSVSTDPNNPGLTRIQTSASNFLAIGDTVRFHKIPLARLPWLKGTWPIFAVTPPYLEIRYPANLAQPIYTAGADVQKVAYLYSTVSLANFFDFRTRKTGRPTSATRGRSSGVHYRR